MKNAQPTHVEGCLRIRVLLHDVPPEQHLQQYYAHGVDIPALRVSQLGLYRGHPEPIVRDGLWKYVSDKLTILLGRNLRPPWDRH